MLRVLLDEHISPAVTIGLRSRNRALIVRPMNQWEKGNFLGQDDSLILQVAAIHKLTLVTYDRRTIPPLLKQWAEESRPHGGVIFVDDRTIPSSDIGSLVKSLAALAKETRKWDWTDRVVFLRR